MKNVKDILLCLDSFYPTFNKTTTNVNVFFYKITKSENLTNLFN